MKGDVEKKNGKDLKNRTAQDSPDLSGWVEDVEDKDIPISPLNNRREHQFLQSLKSNRTFYLTQERTLSLPTMTMETTTANMSPFLQHRKSNPTLPNVFSQTHYVKRNVEDMLQQGVQEHFQQKKHKSPKQKARELQEMFINSINANSNHRSRQWQGRQYNLSKTSKGFNSMRNLSNQRKKVHSNSSNQMIKTLFSSAE